MTMFYLIKLNIRGICIDKTVTCDWYFAPQVFFAGRPFMKYKKMTVVFFLEPKHGSKSKIFGKLKT